jgi:hypothetical protein
MFTNSDVFGEALLKLEPKQVHSLLEHGCSGDRTTFEVPCLALLSILSVSESQPLSGDGFAAVYRSFSAYMRELCKQTSFLTYREQRAVFNTHHIAGVEKIRNLRARAARHLVRCSEV